MVRKPAQVGAEEQLVEEAQADVRQLVAGYAPLTRDELAALLVQSPVAAPPGAGERLVQGTLWVVLEAAEAHNSSGLPLEDLFQEGSTALVTLVHGLDPNRPPTPDEFLDGVRQAVGQVIDGLVAEEEEARLEDLRWAADAERLFAADAELRLNSATPPTDVELAAHLGWPVARVAQLRRAVEEARSQHDVELMDVLREIETP
ncbi:MAG TPA: hypothetical protein VI138_07065 [Candidatus Dormibacteraeota bacterium]